MNTLNFPGICCYIPQGPDSGTADDIKYWSTIMSKADDDEGVISRHFSYKGSSGVIVNKDVSDVGPVGGVYDPEWDAFITGEF